MDSSVAEALIALNNRFYAEHAASFSATRSAPWDGWRKLLGLLLEHGWPSAAAGDSHSHSPAFPPGNEKRSVLDLACGNLRFEQFLAAGIPGARLTFHAVDSCPPLAEGEALGLPSICYHEVDVLENALVGRPPLAGIPTCDLSVCFGFMHHVPGAELRRSVLDMLVAHTAPGGLIAVSFWQFMHDERLSKKALLAGVPAGIDTARLDVNDHFLGWQSDPSPLRYCHHFPEPEIDELVASVGTRTREVARYSADGASGTLNRYLVLERTS